MPALWQRWPLHREEEQVVRRLQMHFVQEILHDVQRHGLREDPAISEQTGTHTPWHFQGRKHGTLEPGTRARPREPAEPSPPHPAQPVRAASIRAAAKRRRVGGGRTIPKRWGEGPEAQRPRRPAPPQGQQKKGHGNYDSDRPPILSVVNRSSGEVRWAVCRTNSQHYCEMWVSAWVKTGEQVRVCTDEWGGYSKLSEKYQIEQIGRAHV